MAYRIDIHATPAGETKRILLEVADKALSDFEKYKNDRPELVHKVRKRCKKARAMLRLARPALGEKRYKRENKRWRDAARRLSKYRDASARIEAVDTLGETDSEMNDPAAVDAVRHSLKLIESELYADRELDSRLDQFLADISKARESAIDLPLANASPDSYLAGLKKTYKRGRQAMATAFKAPAVESFHEWRKRAKYHYLQTRLLQDVWPTMMKARRKEAHDLSDLLGDAHDLAVLQRDFEQFADGAKIDLDQEKFTVALQHQRNFLRQKARVLGAKVFAEKPAQIEDRLLRFWRAEAAPTTPVAA